MHRLQEPRDGVMGLGVSVVGLLRSQSSVLQWCRQSTAPLFSLFILMTWIIMMYSCLDKSITNSMDDHLSFPSRVVDILLGLEERW